MVISHSCKPSSYNCSQYHSNHGNHVQESSVQALGRSSKIYRGLSLYSKDYLYTKQPTDKTKQVSDKSVKFVITFTLTIKM